MNINNDREKLVQEAIKAFNSTKEYVDCNMHYIIADDFLRQNMGVEDYLSCRPIFSGHLFVCLLQLTNKNKNIEEKICDILRYCEDNNIKFDKIVNLRSILSIDIDCYRWEQKLINIQEKYNYQTLVEELNDVLTLSKKNHIDFGICEYLAYFSVAIEVLAHYNTLHSNYPLINEFYNNLRKKKHLDHITCDDSCQNSGIVINIPGMTINSKLLTDIAGHYKMVRMPLLVGTIEYASNIINNTDDNLNDINKLYIKRKFNQAIKR